MNGLRKKCEKPLFFAFWAKMANFGQFLAKMGKTGIFSKKEFGTFFSQLQALINCKDTEKSNVGILRKMQTSARCWVTKNYFSQVYGHIFGQKCQMGSIWSK